MSNAPNAMKKIAVKVIPSYHFAWIFAREFAATTVFSKNRRDLRREVFTQKERYALRFALRALLVILRAREEKEVEIACLGVSHLPGEIRSKKGANSWRRTHGKETER